MNNYLIVFLIVLAVYSGIWVGLKYAFYEQDVNHSENMWYVQKEPDMSVSIPGEATLANVHNANPEYLIYIYTKVTPHLFRHDSEVSE